MGMTILKGLIAAAIIVAVSELAPKWPRWGGLVLTLPLTSILAFIVTWQKEDEMATIVGLARETLVLVPLGLPFFIPFAVADRSRLSFWPSFVLGVLFAAMTIGLWFRYGPQSSPEPRAAAEAKDQSGS